MAAPTPELTALVAGPSRWHTIDHHAEVGSTNDVAAAALAAGVPPGCVVVADRQLAGRGRRGRRWEDPLVGASLPVSVTLGAPPTPTLVPLVAGTAVLAALESAGVTAAELKWPNDVLVAQPDGTGTKLVGILAEGTAAGIVLGIGVNVDLRRSPVAGATSVAEQLDRDVDRWALLAALLRALDRGLTTLDAGRDAEVLAAYRARCGTLGSEVVVDLATGERLRGRAVDVTPTGGLVVARTDDTEVEVTAGDVRHVRGG